MDPAQHFAALGDVTGPLPSSDAPDEAWDRYFVAAEFESVLAGMVSRRGEPKDLEYVVRLRQLLADASLRRGLGDRFGAAEALVEALSARRM